MVISLGAFELHQRIGKGAMGEVWSGRHTVTDVPVAVKVLDPAQDSERRYRDAFANEVRAVAGLTHPGIVMVLEHGRISAETSDSCGGALVADSPFLVMEFASGGSLDQSTMPLSWPVARAVLLALLDALAHAHARRVVHLDLKPANILIASRDDLRPGIKLTDFGIAHAIGQVRSDLTEQSVGTPQYMAPEQVEGRWRDYGPWTDLYSLGIVAWELVCGAVPFEAENFVQQAYMHLAAPLPDFAPAHPVPPGLGGWLRRLLHKAPEARFRRVADAAWALKQLVEVGSPVEPRPVMTLTALGRHQGEAVQVISFEPSSVCLGPVLNRSVTPPGEGASVGENTLIIPEDALLKVDGESQDLDDVALDATMDGTPPPVSSIVSSFLTASKAQQEADDEGLEGEAPPLSETWRRATPQAAGVQLLGAGLGLYGLRAVPLVGRVGERDLIWQALCDVAAVEQSRAVLLRGPAGVGKSRLIEWLCERAHELGAATVLRASHSPDGGPETGLPRMLAQHLRCVGLEGEALAKRVQHHLHRQDAYSEYEWRALVELMAPGALGDQEEGIKFNASRELYVLLRRFVERLTEERPVIIWLDDVQWGVDALAFTRYLLESPLATQGPVLVLMSARDEALAERPQEASMLTRLMECERAESLTLSPLQGAERTALIQEILGLEGELAAALAQRCGGNPLFAVQLIGDWVERGVLEVGAQGFVLRGGESAVLPDNIHEIWKARVDRLLGVLAHQARPALELAAVLGDEVLPAEWASACEIAGLAPPAVLLDMLARHRLVQSTDAGWCFVHNMLRESLERMAADSGRLVHHHHICARALERVMEVRPAVAERLGHHYLAAGDPEAAFEPLLRAARQRRGRCQFREAATLLQVVEEGLRGLNLSEADPRRGLLAVEQVTTGRLLSQFEEAQRRGEAAVEAGRRLGWRCLPDLLRALGGVLRHRGELVGAQALFQEALERYSDLGDEARQALAIKSLADVALQRGDLNSARVLFDRGHRISERLGESVNAAHCLQGLGRVARRRADFDVAAMFYQRAYEAASSRRNMLGMAVCINSLGDIARFRGNHAAAEAHYGEAISFYDAIDSAEGVVPRLNLGLILLRQRRFMEARPVFDAGREIFERRRQLGMLGFVHTALLVCAAALADWSAWELHLLAAEEHLGASRLIDPDIAWPAQLAGELVAAAGHAERAARVWALALGQWEALGKVDESASLRRAIAALKV